MTLRLVRLGAVIVTASFFPACTDAGLTDEDARVVVSVEVTTSTDILDALGATTRLSARATNAIGDVVSGRTFTWASSDLLVARVDDDGNVEAAGNGVADITATADGVTGGARITVEQAFFQLVFDSGPTDALIGESVGRIAVRAEDGGGSALRSGAGTVTLRTTPGSPGQVFGGSLQTVMAAGHASFAEVRVDGAGPGYRLEATWDGETAVSSPFDVVVAFDAVAVGNVATTGDEVGIFVDGLRSGVPLNDFPVTSSSTVVEVGAVRSSGAGGNDEVVVFAPGRRPALVRDVDWTETVDTIDVTLGAPLEVDLAIWIVKGPFVDQSTRARSAVARTTQIWNAERAGVVVDSVEVIDATADSDASKYHDVTLCNSKGGLETDIGFQQGKINIYYVGTVDSGTDRGRACPIGGVHVVMAERSGFELLSHEIGHLFSLIHVDGITAFFDQTNVMHSASSVRRFLTEGQIFRQQFSPNSALNGAFGMRTAESRACSRDVANALCPAIEGRIWDDGGFPATSVAAPTLAEASAPAPNPVSGDDPVARWVDIRCEMNDNEGLSDRVRALGDVAVVEFESIATGPAQFADQRRRRVAALDGLVMVGGPVALETLERLADDGPADLRGAATVRLLRLR